MILPTGSRLGPYEIVAPLGAGGMGEVYRGRDTRLDRTVAIKVLTERLSTDAEARVRFEREARTISQLSHPNICALYDVGPAGDPVAYLVMEYLEGETLADRLAAGPLPLPEVLRYGAEIASALDRAHRAGVVHRDLKPGNVMLTKTGVKLLDFGLAKVFAPAGPVAEWSSLPTAEHDLTRDGSILGTLSYMSPEQLQGKPADARADIFALGAVLYEMSTGKRAFPGSNQASVIAAIMSAEVPHVSAAVPASPRSLDRLVRTCLAKDPADRWQSARDVALQLSTVVEESPAAPARTGRPVFAWLPWAVALLCAAGAVWMAVRGQRPAVTVQTVSLSVPPPPGTSFRKTVETRYFALSPDGRTLGFVAEGPEAPPRIFLRPLASLDARPLTGTEGATSLFWSPDSRSLGFFSGAKLKRIVAEGAEGPVPICDVREGIGYAGSWGADGRIVFATVQGDTIDAVTTSGGAPEAIVKRDPSRKEGRVHWPTFLPDGRRFIYVAHHLDGGAASLMIVEPGQPPRTVGPIASDAQVLDPDLLLFVREGTLLGQRIDAGATRLLGEPFPVSPSVDYFYSSGSAGFSASRAGSIAFHDGEDRARFVWCDRSGRVGDAVGMAGQYLNLRLSPDGRRVLFHRTRPGLGTWDVWMLDLERGGETRVTSDPDTELAGAWMPDLHTIVYSAVSGFGPRLRKRDLDTGRDEELLPGTGFQQALDVSPDGRTLAFIERTGQKSGQFEAFTLELDGERRRAPLYPSGFGQGQVRFSPDGHFVAFVSDETGRGEVYVAPFPPTGGKVRVSSDGARLLRWGRGTGELLYLSADRKVVSVPVKTAPTLEIGKPVTLFVLPGGSRWLDFDVTPDGQRLLAIVNEVSGGEVPISVVTGWAPPAR